MDLKIILQWMWFAEATKEGLMTSGLRRAEEWALKASEDLLSAIAKIQIYALMLSNDVQSIILTLSYDTFSSFELVVTVSTTLSLHKSLYIPPRLREV